MKLAQVNQSSDESTGGPRGKSCAACGAALSPRQRYCHACGERLGALSPLVAERVGVLLRRKREVGQEEDHAPEAAAEKPAAEDSPPEEEEVLPTPSFAALAVMALLAFGVVVGTIVSPIATGTGTTALLLSPSRPAALPSSPLAPASSPAGSSALPVQLPVAAPASLPLSAPAPSAAPVKPTLPPELPPPSELPPVRHVFMIVLGEGGYDDAFAPDSTAPYLAKTLTKQGELLSNYYAVAAGGLANRIALVSGQGPTPETAANCATYADIVPATIDADGQVAGTGCVYPPQALTLADQLTTKGLRWRAYVEGLGNGDSDQATCRHPALDAADLNQAPLPGDAYLTAGNPFVYFHSLLDSGACAADDVGLDRLAPDLKARRGAPSFFYIAPNACHDGGEESCESDQPAGLPTADAFLKTIVPQIQASPSYKDGGLIAITFAQAPQGVPNADTSSCCATPTFPNLPPDPALDAVPVNGPIKPSGGGGRVGLLLISPFVKPGSVNESGYYNHFSLLLSIERLFDLDPLGYASNLALSSFDETVFNADS